jgi:hypothetical protein
MIEKTDLILLLSELEDNNVDISKYKNLLLTTKGVNLDVLKFINDQRPLEVTKFYERLRKSYNEKKSNLYMNICKSDEDKLKDKDVPVIISSLLTQILLSANKITDVSEREMFISHSRATDLTKALLKYELENDLNTCMRVLRVVKADMKALESIK